MTDPERLVTWAEHERQMRRQDNIEAQFARLERERLRAMQGDIAALRRSIEKLVAAKGSAGQPDWMGNRDPAVARKWLSQTWEWVESIARPLGLHAAPCWPWHGPAIAVLLAGAGHYRAAHEGDSASALTDFHTRYLEAIGKRVRASTGECDRHRHKLGSAYFSVDEDPPGRFVELAAWHALGAEGSPPGLRPYVAAGG